MSTRKSRAKWKMGNRVVSMADLAAGVCWAQENDRTRDLVFYMPWSRPHGPGPRPHGPTCWAMIQNLSWHVLESCIRNGRMHYAVRIEREEPCASTPT